MKKVLILLLLAFALVGCETIERELSVNKYVEGYVMVKSTMYNDVYTVYFDPNEYIWYDDENYGVLNEWGMYYLYTPIEVIPFYELANKNKVMIYGTGRNSVEIFVKASDIHTIKIEV